MWTFEIKFESKSAGLNVTHNGKFFLNKNETIYEAIKICNEINNEWFENKGYSDFILLKNLIQNNNYSYCDSFGLINIEISIKEL